MRQFEFAQNVWINDRVPRAGQRTRSDRRHPGRHAGLHDSEAADPQGAQRTARVHHPHGRGLLLPARPQCAALPRHARQLRGQAMSTPDAGTHLQPEPHPAKAAPGSGASASTGPGAIRGKPNAIRPRLDNRFSTMTEVRNVAVADLRNAGVRRGAFPAGHRRHAGAVPPLDAGLSGVAPGSDRPPRRGVSAHRPGRLPAADRRADPRRHRHPDGVRPRPPLVRAGSRTRGNRRDPGVAATRRHLPAAGAAPRRRLHRRLRRSARSNIDTTATRWCRVSSGSASTPAR